MLKDKLREDIKTAMKTGDAIAKSVLVMVVSAIKNRELDKRAKFLKTGGDTSKIEEVSQLTDEEVIETISSEIKKRKESIETFSANGRPELAEGEKKELEVLMKYMPEQMSEDAIRVEVKKVIAETGATIKEMGKAIGSAMAKMKGKADGTVVSRIMKEELTK